MRSKQSSITPSGARPLILNHPARQSKLFTWSVKITPLKTDVYLEHPPAADGVN
ncbi:hypothetical protein JOD24_002458 [Kroppenstedtia sanguinis]